MIVKYFLLLDRTLILYSQFFMLQPININYETVLNFQYLYLEGNELTSLPDDFFDCLPRLTWLDLRRNKLLRLPSVYTGRHNHLRTLLLEGNKLRSLPLELGNKKLMRI